MAKKKYYTSFDELVIGLTNDCAQIFDLVCEQLREELEDLIVGYIYSKPETDTYMRTYEMAEKGLVTYKKLGKLNAEFYFDGKHIVTIDNPYHNVLDEGGTLEEMVDIASYGRIEDMRVYLVKRFPQLYRQYIKNL